MGSFALQQFLIGHSGDVDAAVLSGTSALDVIGAGIDPDAEVDLSAFNAPFEPAPTEYEWLSRDRAEVDAYVADDACGFGLDATAARGMLEDRIDQRSGFDRPGAGRSADLPHVGRRRSTGGRR